MKRPQPGSYGAETGFAVRNCDSPLSAEEYQRLPKNPLYLVLDDLRSAFNVGSIFRIADTARLAGMVTCGYTAHPPHPKLDKTALGTLAYVPAEHFGSALEAVEALHQRGIPVWALETTSHSQVHTEATYPRPLALVLGNEALGVSGPVLERCEALIEIPMYGYKNSLNVAVACGVVVYEVLRQWGAGTGSGEVVLRS
jgi:tRNA G18 (ribose-2'-O)-methylase SpoU